MNLLWIALILAKSVTVQITAWDFEAFKRVCRKPKLEFTGQVEGTKFSGFFAPVKITSNNKIAEKICLKEKSIVTYFQVNNKSITLQCFAEKEKYNASNEKSCVTR